MPHTGRCTDVTCTQDLTELYECHCCGWLLCLKHLLNHVEIAQKEKKEQLSVLRNEIVCVSFALELLVDKKALEIECEKDLLAQAKTKLEKSDCSIEELQEVLEGINHALSSNGKEETIVKVESSLSEIQICSSNNNQLSKENIPIYISCSPSKSIYPQKKSSGETIRLSTDLSEVLTKDKSDSVTSEDDCQLSDVNIDDCHVQLSVDDTIDLRDDMSVTKKYNLMYSGDRRVVTARCSLTFDGAFGLTTATHCVTFCQMKTAPKKNLLTHLRKCHALNLACSQRICEAVRYDLDPTTTKLFSENEWVLDPNQRLPCPFRNTTKYVIKGRSTKILGPLCQSGLFNPGALTLHLKRNHKLSTTVARRVSHNYRTRISKRNILQENHTAP